MSGVGSSPDMGEVKTCGGVSWVFVKDAIEKLERPTGVPMLSLTSSSVILCVLRDDLLIF